MDDMLFNTLFVADESVERDDASLQERGSSEDEDGAEHCDEGSHIATDRVFVLFTEDWHFAFFHLA